MPTAGLFLFTLLALAWGRPSHPDNPHSNKGSPPCKDNLNDGTCDPALGSPSAVRLQIGLPSSDIDGLHKAVMEVSDPSSPKYGQHLTKEKVRPSIIALLRRHYCIH